MARNTEEDKQVQDLLTKLMNSFNETHGSGKMQEMIDEDTRKVFEEGRFASLVQTFAATHRLSPTELAATIMTGFSPESFGNMFSWLLSYAIYAAWQRGKEIALDDTMHYGMTLQCIDEQNAIRKKQTDADKS